MRKLPIIAICLFGLSACNKPVKTTDNTIKKETPSVGADKDDHGCMPSAGQTWSELKQDCIQVFNQGFRLNPTETKKGDAVISAFVLLSDDQSKVELFLPDSADHHSILMDKISKNTYQKEKYKYDSYKSILYINGVEKYKGDVE